MGAGYRPDARRGVFDPCYSTIRSVRRLGSVLPDGHRRRLCKPRAPVHQAFNGLHRCHDLNVVCRWICRQLCLVCPSWYSRWKRYVFGWFQQPPFSGSAAGIDDSIHSAGPKYFAQRVLAMDVRCRSCFMVDMSRGLGFAHRLDCASGGINCRSLTRPSGTSLVLYTNLVGTRGSSYLALVVCGVAGALGSACIT